MRIAATTPHGHVGYHLTPVLIRAGVRQLLLTRHPGRVPAELARHVEVARADSREPDQVMAAARDVEAVHWVDPPAGSADPLEDHARATESITAAVTRSGIRRVVFQSSVGAEKRHGAGRTVGGEA